ncbi:PAN domain protein [Gregarina niphandrodes]|uniref:PAN domain protein n=1 Tax=Gregarina niphandrodes TaxID=110365 RepID=A0A023B0X6_GRENI|nr:PAN domain protein [Gregarina niphandrodes]EZG45633.1 PAN domain protein [Gregarina niphandrodes]|eukprot:XP_011132466.1 PAN domain protein [Gregarina niphandrodes]
MRLQTYQLIGLFAATAAGSCPYAPDPSTGVCGECPDVRDSQCVVNGNWYSCFQDLETCCDDWSIQGSLGTEHCLAASGGAKVNCDDVVALDASVWNYQCRDKCLAIQDDGGNPKDDASFASLCGVETLEVVNGHTTSSGSCFDNWIYGYSEPAELAGYFSHDYVISPALCQMLCQNDPTCVRFTFSIGEGTNDKTGRCVLKNADQVASPLETVFPGGKGLNSNYCNTEMENACKNLYDCLKCNDTTRCVNYQADYYYHGQTDYHQAEYYD